MDSSLNDMTYSWEFTFKRLVDNLLGTHLMEASPEARDNCTCNRPVRKAFGTFPLMLVISSHGNNNTYFQTYDKKMHSLKEVRANFSSKKCPQLENKPFIVISDCCRGGDLEAEMKSLTNDGMENLSLQNPTGQRVTKDKVYTEQPRIAHMATIYSSSEGIISRGNNYEESFSIAALCRTIEKHPREEINDNEFDCG